MTHHNLYSIMYGFMAIYLGPGSMFFHASFTVFGGFLDSLSMYLFVGFIIIYNFVRLTNRKPWINLIIYIILQIICCILWWIFNPINTNQSSDEDKSNFPVSLIVFTILVVTAILSELVIGIVNKLLPSWKLWVSLGCFICGFIIWNLSKTGNVLCFSGLIFQGHALWHILSAMSVLFYYWYLYTCPPGKMFIEQEIESYVDNVIKLN